jgi:hypothetical protein|tara:strand:+ start:519 stop:701 length:183 start_codon:yes stop_codon:yes gene_type:complete
MITIELKIDGIEVRAGDKLIITSKEDLYKAVNLFLDDEEPVCELSPYAEMMINGCPTCEN